jgi:hypothetical protein
VALVSTYSLAEEAEAPAAGRKEEVMMVACWQAELASERSLALLVARLQ